MNIALGMFSGVLLLITLPNLFYVKNQLKAEAADYTFFDNITKSSWLLKPVLGYFSDSFYPFHYRLKSYILIFSVMMIVCCYMVSILPRDLYFFTIIVALIYFAVGFIDTQAEGLTAVVTKMEGRIEDLKAQGGRAKEVDSNQNIGNFLMFRNLIRYIAIFLGGAMSDSVAIETIYLILGVPPIILMVYTLFFFTELKVS